MGTDDHSTIQTLMIAVCVVIVAWGIRTTSHVLSIVLLSLLLAYAILPFPLWLVRRFHVPKRAALSFTVLLVEFPQLRPAYAVHARHTAQHH